MLIDLISSWLSWGSKDLAWWGAGWVWLSPLKNSWPSWAVLLPSVSKPPGCFLRLSRQKYIYTGLSLFSEPFGEIPLDLGWVHVCTVFIICLIKSRILSVLFFFFFFFWSCSMSIMHEAGLPVISLSCQPVSGVIAWGSSALVPSVSRRHKAWIPGFFSVGKILRTDAVGYRFLFLA